MEILADPRVRSIEWHDLTRLSRAEVTNELLLSIHVEHHLFPKVPTCHLPRLAERLDRVAPELREMRVF